jgi:uncharacterized protein YcfL
MMKNLLLLFSLSAVMLISGCQKDTPIPTNDPASKFVGIYNVPVNNGSGLTQIQIVRVNDRSFKVILKITDAYYQYTATTLQNVTISGTNTATINETQNIIEATDLGPYVFSGTIMINGTNATLSGTAISVKVPYNDNSPMNFSFSGKKVQ